MNSQAITFCIKGTRAEFEGRNEDARKLFVQAWKAARDDYEACIAAHYIARYQDSPQETLRWNQEALSRADLVGDERVRDFYPSLYVNMGHSHEMLGNIAESKKYYKLAADLGLIHQSETDGPYTPRKYNSRTIINR